MPTGNAYLIDNIIARSDWRNQLAKDYANTTTELVQLYDVMLYELGPKVFQFGLAYERLAQKGEVSGTSLAATTEYEKLYATMNSEYRAFTNASSSVIKQASENATLLGVEAAFNLAIRSADGESVAEIKSAWNRPDPEAVAQAISAVYTDEFNQKWAEKSSHQAANIVAAAIGTGVALGRGADAIAATITKLTKIPLHWARNAARTNQMWAFRTASHLSYQENANLLDGWIWWSSRNRRTCPSCWAAHGEQHPLTEMLNDHHQGTCTAVPVVKGSRWPGQIKSGPEEFEALPLDMQLEIMGPTRLEALKSGRISWTQMSSSYNIDHWGSARRVPSLASQLSGQVRPPAPHMIAFTQKIGPLHVRAKGVGVDLAAKKQDRVTVDHFPNRQKMLEYLQANGMGEDELAAFRSYSRHGDKLIRDCMSMTDDKFRQVYNADRAEWIKVRKTLNRAIEGIPAYNQPIYRQMNVNSLKSFRGGKLEVGETITTLSPASFGAAGSSYFSSDYNLILEVEKPLSGAPMAGASAYPSEREVVVAEGTQYRVTKVTPAKEFPVDDFRYRRGEDAWVVSLEEIPDE